ncbi:alkaline phosphatase D family protein [Citreimonas salinaria]|uniref:PhoD-like phosphatase n=1 Tax=Citreimonas salinaria TaxID=321339 RepID=A0A1H3IJB1_9RHOB|nr:alkaline phosphatase D family protein [Citreimonas salinaria]SDY26924.1 PhoD-like phosphatase [Citreimonas salinaria]
MTVSITGPVLILDSVRDDTMRLAALFVAPADTAPPPVETEDGTHHPEAILSCGDRAVWRARFDRPATSPSHYAWAGTRFDLAGAAAPDPRIAYVSCNGEEHGDLDRDPVERNVIWARLGEHHREAPFALLIHGGDQVYADEATDGHPASAGWPDAWPEDPESDTLEDLRVHLRQRFFDRYHALYTAEGFRWLTARVPSVMQWDDHDICDGWGSLPRSAARSSVGRLIFDVAREMALAFQHGTRDGDLPARFADPDGSHLGWQVDLPGLRLLAPDLRSQRTRREIMGREGWDMVEDAARDGFAGRTLFISSVPLLGPRLSLLELLMVIVPKMQKYEDDLRDQWQSRAHRSSWRRMLQLCRRMAAPESAQVTVVSGEIHLATRATMGLDRGKVLHQLVASGVSHPAPPVAWARTLGTLATLGESPLRGHPIRIHPLPGQSGRYTAQRNALILDHEDGAMRARWLLEESGPTPPLVL